MHPPRAGGDPEARRKAVEGKIRRIAVLLDRRSDLSGIELRENERLMLQEIDALFRTSPIAHKKPTPVEEADTIIDIFDSTLFDMVPEVYRRFDDWELGEKAGTVPPICPAFFHPGSWIGSDRDGNPNVTARVSRKVAEKFRTHMLEALAERTRYVGRNLTLDAMSTPPSEQLVNLWSHQVEMSEALSSHALEISADEMHRAAMLVIADRNPIREVLAFEPLQALPLLALRIRLEQASPVRCLVQTRDGHWHVGGAMAQAAGGGCTVPGVTRADGSWSKTLNQVHARFFGNLADGTRRLRVQIMHPMDTGLVAGVPALYIERLELQDTAQQPWWRMQLHEPVSENPLLTVEMPLQGPKAFRLLGQDNNGNRIDAEVRA